MDLNHQDQSLEENPGAYPIPFHIRRTGVELGSRLDSISPSARYWAVGCVDAPWHDDVVQANNRYEEWLNTRPPGAYPVPFDSAKGQRLDEISDKLRSWAVHPDRSSAPWYNFFKKANDRYEQHLAATQKPGDFLYPPGNHGKYTGMPIKDVPQDVVWWALRPSNRNKYWYQAMYDANKCILDDVYQSRSPASEPIWFSKRHKGLPLYMVYRRKGFMNWIYSPERQEAGFIYRFKDLVERYRAQRRARLERSGRRKTPDIQNPVGEAIGPWNDSAGSADEDDSEPDSDMDDFIQSDSDEIVYASDHEDEPMDDESNDSDGSDSVVELSVNRPLKRKRANANVALSDHSEEETSNRNVYPNRNVNSDVEMSGGNVSPGKLGRKYRLWIDSKEGA